MEIESKKILVISHNSFSKSSNNGKTLESMFSWVSRENIAQLFFSENEFPDHTFCSNYYKITDIDILKTYLGIESSKAVIDQNYFQKDSHKKQNSKAKLLFNTLKTVFKRNKVFRDKLWRGNRWKNPRLMNWVNNFNPDLIFYLGGDFKFSHQIATNLSESLNIPLVVYFTDDYIIYPKVVGILEKSNHKRLIETYQRTISKAEVSFAIGEKMAKEYSEYFGQTFYPIMNSVHVLPYQKKEESQTIIISYFGGLHLNRDNAILRLGKLLELKDVELRIYSNSEISSKLLNQFKLANIKYMGPVFGEDLKNAILSSNYLLHVESDDPFIKSITKLSISTKIPEYISFGRTVIGFGPPDLASMEFLKEYNIGYYLNIEDDDFKLKKDLANIINDKELSTNLAVNGYNFAKEKFNNKIVTDNFKFILNKYLYGDSK